MGAKIEYKKESIGSVQNIFAQTKNGIEIPCKTAIVLQGFFIILIFKE